MIDRTEGKPVPIPERINEVQKVFELDDVQLGEIAGVSKQAVGRWKNLNIQPGAKALINIRKKLGVSDVWLLDGVGEMRISDNSAPAPDVQSVVRWAAQADKADVARLAKALIDLLSK